MKLIVGLLTLFFLSLPALADVRLASLFGDHMILQQKSSNAIWGRAEPGEIVEITASWGKTASATADKDGKWSLQLDTPEHGTGHSLTIRGDNEIIISDVAIGEVWLCAGQSNMGWSTGNSFEAEGESDVNLPGLRIYKSAREHWHEPLDENRDRLARWKPCNPESAAETSAVSYYFGKTLHQKLTIPVGIIQRAYAGTPIEGWMPWEIQKDDPRAVAHKVTIDAGAKRQIERQGKTKAKALDAFEKELAIYNEKIAAGETMKNPTRPLAPPIITQPSHLGHQYPQNIYNAMILPVHPYGVRGMIWYQGERNSKNAAQAAHYGIQLKQLITHYRKLWGGAPEDFPFQFTQLPSWNPHQTKPVEGIEAPWAVSREIMRLAEKDIPNSAMAVTIDTGDEVLLHPKNKKPIGIRHALLALRHTYGKEITASGPRFQSRQAEGRKLILTFDSTDSGLTTAKGGNPDAFAIAGEDRKWHWANAVIDGNTVVLSSSEVENPIEARYAWAMNPSDRNLLYNQEGLPASPFRTDNWPLFDPNADPVDVNKPTKPDGYESVDWERPTMTAALSDATGLTPEITDLNAADISFAREAKLPYLEEPFINPRPEQRDDGLPVAPLTREHGDRRAILKFARELADGLHGEVDSFLLAKNGKLIFESYYRRGRVNIPHYQMSITKSYTSLAVGRAIQMGHLSMADLNKPAVNFLKEIDQSKLVDGAVDISLAEALNMRSGIRIEKDRAKKLMKNADSLKGQGQIAAYLENSAPIPPAPREFKYQGADPSIAMQIVEATVPGTASEFIEAELLQKMGITRTAWQPDVSGLPKAAAGSSMCSRDMIKWGLLMINQGQWDGEQLIPTEYMKQAVSKLHTNDGGSSYGYFWWRNDMQVGDSTVDCISGRGAGGQFIFILPDRDIIAVFTAHNKGMGKMLTTFPERVLSVLK